MDSLLAPDLPSETSRQLPRRGWIVGLGLSAIGAAVLTACNSSQQTWFTRLAESRRLAAELRVQFNKGADASNRSVMADTDEASIRFAAEAEEAKKAVRRDAEAIVPVLQALDYGNELQFVQDFARNFAEYEKMDRAILDLAVENSNLKAQKLSFGPQRAAADAFRDALDAVARSASKKNSCRASLLATTAIAALREIQALEAPHIAESDDAVMAKMEKDMGDLEASARSALQELSAVADTSSAEQLAAASAALDRFAQTRTAIIALSRKNTNVRSLAMSLGQKRGLITACDSSLAGLQDSLAKRGLSATR